MGRKGKWFASVKNAFSPESKEKKDKKLKKKWFGKQKEDASESASLETFKVPPLPQQPEEVKLTLADNVAENELSNHVPTEAVTTAVSARDADQAVSEVQIMTYILFAGKSKEEAAAIRIQTAFRGYLARRALRALRGLVRLKSLMEGSVVKRQAANTLRCMQTLSHLQSQIRTRRVRIAEENQVLQRQFLQKYAKELATQMGEEWDDSIQSKEQIEANLLSKYEATMRRERAMAYSFTHQQTWKNSSKSSNPMFMDPGNPTWGWSWLERWMAARPWESRSTSEKEHNNDESSVKDANHSIVGGEIIKSYARCQLNSDKLSPTTNPKISKTPKHQSPSTPTKSASSTVAKKSKPAIPRGSVSGTDDDSRSMVSMQSYRRHTIAGSSVRDDESLPSSPLAPRYMVPTKSAKAKSRLQSPLEADKNGSLEKATPASAKKRLSYLPSPARPRRHSGPPKLDSSINTEISVTNGSS